jgi:hypothetical protein
LCLALALSAGDPSTQETPELDAGEIMDALLGGLMGFEELTGPELQKQVAEVGGVPFRSEVPLDFMSHDELKRYLRELVDSEYPKERAIADQRTLLGLGLIGTDLDLRALRERVLDENVAGFYDVRPGHKRLYAVSANRRLSPSNQIILAHELRHALQDQYMSIDTALPDSVGDFDDRRMALMSLLEGDATWVMERFLLARLPDSGAALGGDLGGMSLPVPELPGAPPVVRDQLVLPYIRGRDFATALWKAGGVEALKAAWSRPPESTEQVLHPEKYLSRESPREAAIDYAPAGGQVVNEGVLGEMLIATLIGDPEGTEAAAGWGGDRYRVFDVSGRTLLVWRSVWDSPKDAAEFLAAAGRRLEADRGKPSLKHGFRVFGSAGWQFALGERAGGIVWIGSDSPVALEAAVSALGGS